MNKESMHEKKSYKTTKKSNKFVEKGADQAEELKFAGITRVQFVNWLKSLSAEERYLTLKVSCPELARELLGVSYPLKQSWKLDMEVKKLPSKIAKNYMITLQSFIDGLVLISDQKYLDSIGFDFSFVGNPEKLFQTLSVLTSISTKLRSKEKSKLSQQNSNNTIPQKQYWVNKLLAALQEDYSKKRKSSWDPLILQRQKNQKKQFGNFWRNLNKTQKINFLLLQHEDIKSLTLEFIQENIKIDPEYLEEQINQLLNLDKKQICNKVFKCKIKKISPQICSYYEKVYYSWRDFSYKKKTDNRSHYKNKNKIQCQSQTQSPVQNKRQKSVGACSNETNETQLKQSRILFQVSQQTIFEKIQEDILESADEISQKSNQIYEARVLAFQRIAAVFRLYGVTCKLFGSCANGIAINKSDIDVAINESILQYFTHLDDKKTQMSSAFEFMGQIFQSLPWINNVKVIKTAAIPIIKLTVDTSTPVTQEFFTAQYRQILNQSLPKSVLVQADLTIQTTQGQSSNHLGVVSTNQINKWLDQIPTLRPIIILLKYQLAKRQMNQTYLGGINTYCLVVMIVSFIVSHQLENQKNVASVMIKLLNFYGWQFDQKNFGIDLREKKSIFYEKSKNQQQKFADLEVKDPLNHGKVMTKNCYQFVKIRQVFRDLYTNCFQKKQKQIKESYLNITKRLSKRKTKQQSETQSGSQKQKLRNYFLELVQ